MDRLRALVYGTVLLLIVGWVLHVGKAIFVPAVLGAVGWAAPLRRGDAHAGGHCGGAAAGARAGSGMSYPARAPLGAGIDGKASAACRRRVKACTAPIRRILTVRAP
ncbi:MAG: hypothetical protein WCA12_08505 [Burkholderiales bacterium]